MRGSGEGARRRHRGRGVGEVARREDSLHGDSVARRRGQEGGGGEDGDEGFEVGVEGLRGVVCAVGVARLFNAGAHGAGVVAVEGGGEGFFERHFLNARDEHAGPGDGLQCGPVPSAEGEGEERADGPFAEGHVGKVAGLGAQVEPHLRGAARGVPTIGIFCARFSNGWKFLRTSFQSLELFCAAQVQEKPEARAGFFAQVLFCQTGGGAYDTRP